MTLLAGRKYRTLLVALLVLVATFPLLHRTPETRLLLHLLFSLLFITTLLVVFPTRRLRVVAALFGIPTLVGLWTGYLLPGVPRLPVAVAFHLLAALFFVFTIGAILRDLHGEKGVTADSVYGAFCGYLLTGLAFGHVFTVLDLLSPDSFRGAGLAPNMVDERRHFLLSYFSFVTLTTVGYGDITPGTDAARGLAAVEAVVGQIYIAVLVAQLVGKRVAQAFSPEPPPPA